MPFATWWPSSIPARPYRISISPAPFSGASGCRLLRGEAKTIAWLLAVPVTNGELLCLETQGDDGLEQLYRQRRIDMYGLGRPTWLGS